MAENSKTGIRLVVLLPFLIVGSAVLQLAASTSFKFLEIGEVDRSYLERVDSEAERVYDEPVDSDFGKLQSRRSGSATSSSKQVHCIKKCERLAYALALYEIRTSCYDPRTRRMTTKKAEEVDFCCNKEDTECSFSTGRLRKCRADMRGWETTPFRCRRCYLKFTPSNATLPYKGGQRVCYNSRHRGSDYLIPNFRCCRRCGYNSAWGKKICVKP